MADRLHSDLGPTASVAERVAAPSTEQPGPGRRVFKPLSDRHQSILVSEVLLEIPAKTGRCSEAGGHGAGKVSVSGQRFRWPRSCGFPCGVETAAAAAVVVAVREVVASTISVVRVLPRRVGDPGAGEGCTVWENPRKLVILFVLLRQVRQTFPVCVSIISSTGPVPSELVSRVGPAGAEGQSLHGHELAGASPLPVCLASKAPVPGSCLCCQELLSGGHSPLPLCLQAGPAPPSQVWEMHFPAPLLSRVVGLPRGHHQQAQDLCACPVSPRLVPTPRGLPGPP
ncbi:uncharacterized protein LOC117803531 [Ailuropoda melanoleuca]|uniref:uncharacterized protein LOC117803531 n=1 Tax=Ailuropoda melanoleuca TaxID=9646 RepID=UPI001493F6D3|nr:uncharacterized protein LOC117803531 [Ailuropoda melanoleuca]